MLALYFIKVSSPTKCIDFFEYHKNSDCSKFSGSHGECITKIRELKKLSHYNNCDFSLEPCF